MHTYRHAAPVWSEYMCGVGICGVRLGTSLANGRWSLWEVLFVPCSVIYIRCSSHAQLVFKREQMAHNLLKSVPGRLTQLHSMVGVRQLRG